MQTPPTIRFRRVRPTDALEADVRTRVNKLATYCPSLMGARVLIEPAERHHQEGNRYHVRIDLAVPGEEIVISHEASLRAGARAMARPKTRKQDETDPTHKLLGVAIRDAFGAARRRLQDYVRRQRGDVKAHTARSTPRVSPAGLR